MRQFLSLLYLITAVTATPVAMPIAPGADGRPLARRGFDANNLDVLVPGENGKLVRATAEQKRGALQSRSYGSPLPGDWLTFGNGNCGTSGTFQYTGLYQCPLFCQMSTEVVTGAVQTVSDDIQCTTATCSDAYANAHTITSTWSINGNIKPDDPITVASLGIAAQVTVGFGYSWAESTAVTNTYTFTPSRGDKGHIIFIPYMVQTCGTLTYFFPTTGNSCFDWSRGDGSQGAKVYKFDPMSCGMAPIPLVNDQNFADGVGSCFCERFLVLC
jgi:hypothetical protein